LQASTRDFFREPDREAVVLLARMGSEVSTRLAAQRELRAANMRGESADSVVSILLDSKLRRFELLKKKSEVFDRFVEQLRSLAGPNCTGTGAWLICPLTNTLGAVAANGSGLAAQHLGTPWSPHSGDALQAAVTTQHLYFPMFEGEDRPLWARRFVVHGCTTGVVSVGWDISSGCSEWMHQRFSSLVSQFERILEVLADQDEALFTNF
jgi:hypothetical protein